MFKKGNELTDRLPTFELLINIVKSGSSAQLSSNHNMATLS